MVLMKVTIFLKNFPQEIGIFAQESVFTVITFAQTKGMERIRISCFIISSVVGS